MELFFHLLCRPFGVKVSSSVALGDVSMTNSGANSFASPALPSRTCAQHPTHSGDHYFASRHLSDKEP